MLADAGNGVPDIVGLQFGVERADPALEFGERFQMCPRDGNLDVDLDGDLGLELGEVAMGCDGWAAMDGACVSGGSAKATDERIDEWPALGDGCRLWGAGTPQPRMWRCGRCGR